ncbi:uncharacterized protein B0I36DRAFT_436761 [Microdochium trichocladiopsis]|uniref:Uncharacterized protein n=1 Tax=Microdochium trichocladiopsis TaxID=1682393 RepID=A0A9P8XTL9_9PEZI|nr:uncharacterized protein B0I36DRAFT_436761 [Microdochium trichocladiopsis]KAH7012104.1 hypothetical protein B0I36DRAFT_436761 [Microdochium trichocladiopsis]
MAVLEPLVQHIAVGECDARAPPGPLRWRINLAGYGSRSGQRGCVRRSVTTDWIGFTVQNPENPRAKGEIVRKVRSNNTDGIFKGPLQRYIRKKVARVCRNCGGNSPRCGPFKRSRIVSVIDEQPRAGGNLTRRLKDAALQPKDAILAIGTVAPREQLGARRSQERNHWQTNPYGGGIAEMQYVEEGPL